MGVTHLATFSRIVFLILQLLPQCPVAGSNWKSIGSFDLPGIDFLQNRGRFICLFARIEGQGLNLWQDVAIVKSTISHYTAEQLFQTCIRLVDYSCFNSVLKTHSLFCPVGYFWKLANTCASYGVGSKLLSTVEQFMKARTTQHKSRNDLTKSKQPSINAMPSRSKGEYLQYDACQDQRIWLAWKHIKRISFSLVHSVVILLFLRRCL